MGIDWSLIYLISEWLIRLVMLPVIVMRKERPSTCLAWLAMIFFIPWLGLFLYLLVGETRLGRRRRIERLRQYVAFDAAFHPQARLTHRIDPQRDLDHQTFARLAEQAGGLPIVGGNRVEFEHETERVIDRLVDEIERAEHHVHLLFYIYADDAVGRRVAEALARAVERGVVCRVLVDSVGSRRRLGPLAPWMRQRGVEVAEALRASFLRRPLRRIDVRNHRKLVVIDGDIAMTGSQNIIEPSYGHRTAGVWCDIAAWISGPAVMQMQLIFMEDWFHETNQLLEDPRLLPVSKVVGEAPLQVVPTGPDFPTELFQDLLVEAVHLARKQIIITSPYFVPDEPMLLALRQAAARGVRVQIILPARSDHPLVHAAGTYYADYLVRHKISVYRFRGGLLHAKTMTIDDQVALFGTSNFDIRSFHLNFELNLLIHHTGAVDRLRYLQTGYLQQADEVTANQVARRRFLERLKLNLAKLFSPLL